MERILRAIAVDDEDIALKRISRLIGKNKNLTLVGSYSDSEEALKKVISDKIDVVFLDIEMSGMNGLELAEQLMNNNPNLEVIFVTAFDKYALKAFQVNAIGYLLKPIEEDQINAQIEKLLLRLNWSSTVEISKKLFIRCFGGFECTLDDELNERLDFRTAKALELLAYLNDKQGKIATRDEIIEDLWNDMDAERATNNFYTTTYYLRKAFSEKGISDIMLYKNSGYYLNKEKLQSDLDNFTAALGKLYQDKLSIEELEGLSEFYKGAYLQGKDYIWATEKQLKFELDFERIQLNLTDKYIKEKMYLAALISIKKLLKHICLSEEGNKKLILIYIETGEKQKAIATYKDYCMLLKNELGVKPTFEITNII